MHCTTSVSVAGKLFAALPVRFDRRATGNGRIACFQRPRVEVEGDFLLPLLVRRTRFQWLALNVHRINYYWCILPLLFQLLLAADIIVVTDGKMWPLQLLRCILDYRTLNVSTIKTKNK